MPIVEIFMENSAVFFTCPDFYTVDVKVCYYMICRL